MTSINVLPLLLKSTLHRVIVVEDARNSYVANKATLLNSLLSSWKDVVCKEIGEAEEYLSLQLVA